MRPPLTKLDCVLVALGISTFVAVVIVIIVGWSNVVPCEYKAPLAFVLLAVAALLTAIASWLVIESDYSSVLFVNDDSALM